METDGAKCRVRSGTAEATGASAAVSFHILVATVGRRNLLASLKSFQRSTLLPKDVVTVVFDARDDDSVMGEVQRLLGGWPCRTEVVREVQNLGFWGHGIRNSWATRVGRTTTHVLHFDDDNRWLPGGIDLIRSVVASTKDRNLDKTLFCFRNQYVWAEPKIQRGSFDTASVCVPSSLNDKATWQLKRGGDTDFYLEILGRNDACADFVDAKTYLMHPATVWNVARVLSVHPYVSAAQAEGQANECEACEKAKREGKVSADAVWMDDLHRENNGTFGFMTRADRRLPPQACLLAAEATPILSSASPPAIFHVVFQKSAGNVRQTVSVRPGALLALDGPGLRHA